MIRFIQYILITQAYDMNSMADTIQLSDEMELQITFRLE